MTATLLVLLSCGGIFALGFLFGMLHGAGKAVDIIKGKVSPSTFEAIKREWH